MESPEDIEKALARLVPSAISDQGQRSLEELIDSLAAGETAVVEMPSPRRKPWGWMAGGAAAAAAAVTLALFIPSGEPGGTVPLASAPVASEEESGFVVLEQTKHVESAEPEDWTSEADGVTHRAWRVRVVNQERVQDLETGYEVLVSHPQDEVILQPVNTF
jgi:hypothetical protein